MAQAVTNPPAARSWRSIYRVHPCADAFPLLPEAELDALADDIKANGLREPATLWMNRDDGQVYLLDGRNRLDALERTGYDIGSSGTIRVFEPLREIPDPAAFVISKNIRRRHLSKEQQAELIVKTIEAGRKDCAKVARSFSPTAGQRGGSSRDPVLAEAVQEGQKLGISKRTILRARAKVQGKTPAPKEKKTETQSQVQVGVPWTISREQTPVTLVPATKTDSSEPVNEGDSPPARKTIPAIPEMTTTPAITLTTTPRTKRLAAGYRAFSAAVAELRLEQRQGVAITPADSASLTAILNAIDNLARDIDYLAVW